MKMYTSVGAPRPLELCRSQGACAMKARQVAKIREIADALVSEGFASLDEKAYAVGLCRSTTWTIIRPSHKSTGLSSAVITRMLAAPGLPARARAKIIEYVEEKAAGLYGHSKAQRRRFVGRLGANFAASRHQIALIAPDTLVEFSSNRSISGNGRA